MGASVEAARSGRIDSEAVFDFVRIFPEFAWIERVRIPVFFAPTYPRASRSEEFGTHNPKSLLFEHSSKQSCLWVRLSACAEPRD